MRPSFEAAERHLQENCALMRRAIPTLGPCGLLSAAKRAPYESLMRAIAHQQLNGKAAETILGRFVGLYAGCTFPTPEQVLATPRETLRAVGFSEAKVKALHDIAVKTLDGTVPTKAAIVKMPDEAIVERLVAVRGVGRWTVEMLLIFQLGRPDVLPVDDFGIRSGFRVLKKLDAMPTPKALAAYGERWAPHRTVAAWYLWRAADRAKRNAKESEDA
jgi:DNA-3-methyladenine glycosylase II